MKIIDLKPDQKQYIQQTAEIVVTGFKEMAPNAWPTIEAALSEVYDSFAENKISRIAVSSDNEVLGWIGAAKMEHYEAGNTWELHPLVVRSNCQRKGIGRALVNDLETQLRRQNALTLWIGTDDEMNLTSLGGVDLYPNVLEKLAEIKNIKHHPFEFYQKMGFTIVGVLPDANGFGKPDIFMAKRLGNISK